MPYSIEKKINTYKAIQKFKENKALTIFERNEVSCALTEYVAFVDVVSDIPIPTKHIDDLKSITLSNINQDKLLDFAKRVALALKEVNYVDIQQKINNLEGVLL